MISRNDGCFAYCWWTKLVACTPNIVNTSVVMHFQTYMSIMMRKKVCGIMIISALKISSTSGDGPSCSSGSRCVGADTDAEGLWSASLKFSSKPLSRINRHFSSSGISMRGFCSVGGLDFPFRFDMDMMDLEETERLHQRSEPNMFTTAPRA